MIEAVITLYPKGDRSRPEHLGTLMIANDGSSGDGEFGNYQVHLSKWGRPNQAWRRGYVTNFPRKRLGPFDLLLRCLLATVDGRNGADVGLRMGGEKLPRTP